MPLDKSQDASGRRRRWSRRISSAAIIFRRLASLAPPASARNSRGRLNHITTIEAKRPRKSSATMLVIQKPMPAP